MINSTKPHAQSRHLPDHTTRWLRKLRNFARSYPRRVPYCVPYWNMGTYRAIVTRLLSGRVVTGSDIDRLRSALRIYFDTPAVFTFASGRFALEVALRSVGVTHGDEVVLPTFTCRGVIDPVMAIGAAPVLVDVGNELNLTAEIVQERLTPRTRAVIVPHLFGNPADIVAIENVCRQHSVAVIDDAAQALGATFDGQFVGTFGDAGIISFGNGKVCFGTGGGILLTRKPIIANRAIATALQMDNRRECIQRAFTILFMRRWRKWFYLLECLMHRDLSQRKKEQSYRKASLSNLDAAVALTLLKTFERNLRERRRRVSAYVKLLSTDSRLELVEHKSGSACLTQPIKLRNRESTRTADMIIGALRARGYEVNKSYKPLHLTPQFAHLRARNTVYAEQVWDSVIELPCEPSVSLGEIERICRIVRDNL